MSAGKLKDLDEWIFEQGQGILWRPWRDVDKIGMCFALMCPVRHEKNSLKMTVSCPSTRAVLFSARFIFSYLKKGGLWSADSCLVRQVSSQQHSQERHMVSEPVSLFCALQKSLALSFSLSFSQTHTHTQSFRVLLGLRNPGG